MGKIKAKQLALAATFIATGGTGEALDLADNGVAFGKLGSSVPASLLGTKKLLYMVASADLSNPNAATYAISSSPETTEFGFGSTAGVSAGAGEVGIPVLLELTTGMSGGAHGFNTNSSKVWVGQKGLYAAQVYDLNGQKITDPDNSGNDVWAIITASERSTSGTYTIRFYSDEWPVGGTSEIVLSHPYTMAQQYTLAYPKIGTLQTIPLDALRSDSVVLSRQAASIAPGSVTEVEIAASALGDGLTGGDGTVLAVLLDTDSGLEFNTSALRAHVDGTTIERKSGGALGIVDGGVGTTQFAATSVTAAILGSDVAGDGLTGGNGSALAVLGENTSVAVGAGGVKAAVPVLDDKALNPSGAISTDGASTGITITKTPAAGSYVKVSLNGVGVELGSGVKTKDCYFSADGGTTARAISAIVATDTLYWNAVVSGVNLSTSDEIDLDYSNTTA